MRYLILFMVLVGIFMFGHRSSNGWSIGFGGIKGEGPVKSESRSVSNFHGVEAAVPGLTEITVAGSYSVDVEVQANLLPHLKTEVRDGILHIWFDKNVSGADGMKIRISAPAFDELAVAGSGNMKVLSLIQGESLDLSIGGSGEIDAPQADVSRLKCSIAGSGNIHVGGKAVDAGFEIAGSGDIAARDLAAQTGKAEIAGSGSVTCNVTEKLKAEIAGSGDVYYTGSPAVDSDVSGSGKVQQQQ